MENLRHIIQDASFSVFRKLQTAIDMDQRKTRIWHRGARQVSIEVVDQCYAEMIETAHSKS